MSWRRRFELGNRHEFINHPPILPPSHLTDWASVFAREPDVQLMQLNAAGWGKKSNNKREEGGWGGGSHIGDACAWIRVLEFIRNETCAQLLIRNSSRTPEGSLLFNKWDSEIRILCSSWSSTPTNLQFTNVMSQSLHLIWGHTVLWAIAFPIYFPLQQRERC